MAFTGHTSKAATRLAANHSPEPFSNAAVSSVEDLTTIGLLWLAYEYPVAAAGIDAESARPVVMTATGSSAGTTSSLRAGI